MGDAPEVVRKVGVNDVRVCLKPGDSFRPSRLIPAMRPARGNFLQSFQAFFAPCFMPDGLARNQAVTHSTGSCALASRKGIVSLMR